MLSTAELARVRADFPLLEREVHGKPLVYLDWGATSQKPEIVIDAEQDYYLTRNAAVHRGAHTLAGEATELFEGARAEVARFVGAAQDELVWTSGATAGLNLLAYAMQNATLGSGGEAARRFALGPGDEIVVTELEHHANLVPWQQLAARTGASLRWIPATDSGRLDLSVLPEVVRERTRVVAVTHASNVTGAVTDLAPIVARAHEVGALVVLDACQSVPHLALDLPGLGVDFAVFSGHKMLAPHGVGALYGRRELLEALPPVQTGGSMVEVVTMTETTFLPPPQKFEAGTQPVAEAIGFGAAAQYLGDLGMAGVAAHEHELHRASARRDRAAAARAGARAHRGGRPGRRRLVRGGRCPPARRRPGARRRGHRGPGRSPLRAADPPPSRGGLVRAGLARDRQQHRRRRRLPRGAPDGASLLRSGRVEPCPASSRCTSR